MTGDDELEALALEVRRAYGDRFPLPRRDETASDRELREEMTRDVLENQVLAEVERRRLADRLSPLTDAEQHTLVELVLSEMFGLPKLLSVLRDPLVTDVLVFGADPVRVERADGTRQLLSPLVRRDRDLERIIYDTAAARRRPFNREHPFVDLELEPGVRFHGEGFDVVSRPLVTIRRAAVFGARLDDLAARGMLDDAAVALLRAAVAADLSVLVAGRMGSGKTTLLRALIGEIEPTDVLVTIETDFELNIGQMGTHPFVHAYQARIPSTSDGTGISCADMMVPAVRTRADWIVVGEVRGAEGAAMVGAMSIGQGAMATVHGGSAKDGLERLAELIAAHGQVDLRTARWQVYRSVDLVVHTHGDNTTGRYVTEIVAPSVEEDGGRFVLHRLMGPQPDAVDDRARVISEPQRAMLDRLLDADPSFSADWWHHRDETHRPLAGARRELVS
ncbi:MAG: CpaF family protein [Acidimicrobiales bacterium]|nr:CpaF family protein [Acidimicrobiales bacterium]MCB9392545.1 CpaF family protein [Acidimicrobiaceae bacterium]